MVWVREILLNCSQIVITFGSKPIIYSLGEDINQNSINEILGWHDFYQTSLNIYIVILKTDVIFSIGHRQECIGNKQFLDGSPILI